MNEECKHTELQSRFRLIYYDDHEIKWEARVICKNCEKEFTEWSELKPKSLPPDFYTEVPFD